MATALSQGDIGMGIPIEQSPPVYATDLPEQFQSFTPAPSRAVPSAMAPSSRRFSSTRPEFIFTNPAAAQQAASNYAARLGYEVQQDQGYRDYLARLEAERGAGERANVQGQIYGSQLQASGREGAANRASNERITMMSEAVRQHRQDEQAWLENERAAEIGDGVAQTLNADPAAKVDRRYVTKNPTTGRWESIFKRRPRPTPPQFDPATPTAPGPAPQMVSAPWPQKQPLAAMAVPDPGPAPMIETPTALAPSYTDMVAARDAMIEASMQSIFNPMGVPDPGPAPMIEAPTEPTEYWDSDFPVRRRIVVPQPGPAPMIQTPSRRIGRYPAPVGVPFY